MHLRIQWNFGNDCNLDCSYCPKILKNNSSPFPAYEKLFSAIRLISDNTSRYSFVEIEITGGEPSYSPALRAIIQENTDSRIKYRLISNGYADIDWWTSVRSKISSIQLTHHADTDFDHFYQVVVCLKEIRPTIMIAISPENWSKQLTVYETLKPFGHDIHLQFLYSNFTKGNNQYLKYSDEQWRYYYAEQGIDNTQAEKVETTIEFKRQQRLNDYYGHLCWAGVEQVVIAQNGSVYRGWCSPAQALGNVYENKFELYDTPRVCPKFQCTNGFDLQSRKSEGSWRIA
jgi:sulfatase maturation enzyme AslB (radical SAM superfamily)